MPKIRQPYEETRFVPWVGRDVEPGEVVTVPDADLASYLESGWEAADGDTERAARKLRADGVITVGGEPLPEPTPASDMAELDGDRQRLVDDGSAEPEAGDDAEAEK